MKIKVLTDVSGSGEFKVGEVIDAVNGPHSVAAYGINGSPWTFFPGQYETVPEEGKTPSGVVVAHDSVSAIAGAGVKRVIFEYYEKGEK